MTRTMYDSTTAGDIPTSAPMVAGYVDGLYAWSDADWARFPGVPKVRIAVFASTNNGHCLDVETGDATPAQAPGWAQMRRSNGVDPSVYMNDATWPAVRQAFQSQGVAEPHYWVAQWDNVPNIPAGAVAKQYANPALSGGHFDLSTVADFWPGVDLPPPPPKPKEESMVIRNTDDGAVYQVGEGGKRHIGPLEYAVVLALGLPVGPVTTPTVQEIRDVGVPPAVDVNVLATALAGALATHPLTATLSDAERDAVATHVLQHLSKDTAVG